MLFEEGLGGFPGISPAGPVSKPGSPSLALPMAEHQACLSGPFGAFGTVGLSFAPREPIHWQGAYGHELK